MARMPGGSQYGWRLMEGNHCYNPSQNCRKESLVLPIIEYSHSLGCSITGGYRYRGSEIPSLKGKYIYGDYCSGIIWEATKNGEDKWKTQRLFNTQFRISTFGEDESGEIYFAHYLTTDGAIYKLT